MKTSYIKISAVAICLAASMVSCSDWLDVKPKSQIESSDLFDNEGGYKDVLNGAYINMTSKSMYGMDMTYAMVDALGSCYYNAGSGNGYAYALSHKYDQPTFETISNNVWKTSFSTIANINAMLEEMEGANKAMFSTDNYNVIKGEAIGLRAFIHFDLLRLYAPSMTVGADEPAIPYVTDYTFTVTPSSTVKETLNKIITDLKTAASLLKNSDPIATGREITTNDDNGYLLNRQYHMNYYAVVATMARAYLYAGDMANAATCAKEVINCGKFSWTPVTSVAVSVDADRDRTFTQEQIFALQMDNLDEYVVGKVYGTAPYNVSLKLYDYWLPAIFPAATHSTDWRYMYFYSNSYTGGSYYYTNTKLWQEGMNENYVGRMPLIRLPEMYLILAEAGVNPAEQINTIRSHRGVIAPFDATNNDVLNNEITLEYYREFIGEGQMFYHYKRINSDKMYGGYSFTKQTFNTNLYVLPMPEEEQQFGNR